MKETMDYHYWNVMKVSKDKKYLCTNFMEFQEFCIKNDMSIITVRIDDIAGNNNHWVSINNMFIFNTVWKKPVPFTKPNLIKCAESEYYKELGMIYM